MRRCAFRGNKKSQLLSCSSFFIDTAFYPRLAARSPQLVTFNLNNIKKEHCCSFLNFT
ncbi:hypothetical protein PSM_B0094 [Pseudoalteromonas sp. SM9913]|nr:hypothetical protein PSM_B0094 [Pseudoalteromonas sp. SM9913]